MKRTLLLAAFLYALMALVLPASSVSAGVRTVRIAAFNFYPAIFQDKDGTVRGFYVDFLKEIAEREKLDIEYVYGDWQEGLDRIRSGKVDILTNVAFTKERAAFLDFGKEPLLTVWAELYVLPDSQIENIPQVRGKKIAVMKGDFNGANFRNLVEKLSIPCEITEYDNFEEIFRAISRGEVDGGVVNNTFGAAKQSEYRLRSSGVIFNPFDIYFAAAKGKNGEMLALLDSYLEKWRKTTGSPYHKAREKWGHGTASTIQVTNPWVKRGAIIFVAVLFASSLFVVSLRLQVRRSTSELREQLSEREKIETLLSAMNDKITVMNSDKLLDDIALLLAGTTGADYAFISELLPGNESIRTRVLVADGNHADAIEYGLGGTPCENVVGKSFCYYPENVASLFPEDTLLSEMGAEGYAAVPLWSSGGSPIGLAGVISKKPLAKRQLIETALNIVATRVSHELDAIKRLDELELKDFTIEHMSDAVYWISHEGRFRSVNMAATAMLGYSREEFLRMSVWDIDKTASPERWPEWWEAVTKAGSNCFETVHKNKDGRDIPVEIKVTRFRFRESEFNCAIVTDISRRREDEEEKRRLETQLQQAQKMESIGRLAGGIAHDFNNLLTVMIGYAELGLASVKEESPHSSYFEEIRKAAERSAELTQQLLAFARKQTIAPQLLDLNRVVENSLKMLTRLIGENIDLVWKPEEELWKVKIDSTQIDQILANLCVNARDAISDFGKITIETANRTFDEDYCAANYGFIPGEYVLLAVSDDGCGMEKETQKHIFEPFFTTKGFGKGTGLGLAMVYGVVKQNNGFINVYSEPGHGTTFRIYLPASDQKEAGAAHQEGKIAVSSGVETILVVEDEPAILELTARLLEKQGYTVMKAKSATEAISAAREHSGEIHLLLTDVVMPEMNGRDLVRNIVPFFPGIKVLFMSGYTANVIAHHGVLDDGVNFIAKPFSFPDLAAKVREALGKPEEGGKS